MESIVGKIWYCYYAIALFATILFAIKLVLFTLAGAESEVSTDFNSEIDTDASFNFLSIQSILAFLMGFGWMGYASLKQLMLGQIISLVLAIVVGGIFMYVSAYLTFKAKSLEENVNKDQKTAIGKIGKAYTQFQKRSHGKIEIEINGQLTITNAFNDSDKEIKAFEAIKVTNFVQDTLYIEKFEEENK